MIKLKKRGEITENALENMSETAASGVKKKKESQNAVMIYIMIMFVVAILLIFLSYFIQQRRNDATITNLTEQHRDFSIQALQNIEELQNTNLKLTEKLRKSEDRAAALADELEKTKESWVADVKRIEGTVQEEKLKTEAAQRLLDLYMAVENRNDRSVTSAALEKLEPAAGYLDGAYAELYESLKDRLN